MTANNVSQFASASSGMHRTIQSMSLPPGSGYQAPPPGSRHMQRLTFIEEKFPLNSAESHLPGSSQGMRQVGMVRY